MVSFLDHSNTQGVLKRGVLEWVSEVAGGFSLFMKHCSRGIIKNYKDRCISLYTYRLKVMHITDVNFKQRRGFYICKRVCDFCGTCGLNKLMNDNL